MGSLKLGNVWVFVQPIFGPRWSMNQLSQTPDFPSALVMIDELSQLKSSPDSNHIF